MLVHTHSYNLVFFFFLFFIFYFNFNLFFIIFIFYLIHILILESGELYVFGYGITGECGLGNGKHILKPTLLMKDKNIVNVAVGGEQIYIFIFIYLFFLLFNFLFFIFKFFKLRPSHSFTQK